MIVPVVVLHVRCLICKLCHFFGVTGSVKIMRLTRDLNFFNPLIINIGHDKVMV